MASSSSTSSLLSSLLEACRAWASDVAIQGPMAILERIYKDSLTPVTILSDLLDLSPESVPYFDRRPMEEAINAIKLQLKKARVLPVRNVREASVIAQMKHSREWHGTSAFSAFSALLLVKLESATRESIIQVKDILRSNQIHFKIIPIAAQFPFASSVLDFNDPPFIPSMASTSTYSLTSLLEACHDWAYDFAYQGPMAILERIYKNSLTPVTILTDLLNLSPESLSNLARRQMEDAIKEMKLKLGKCRVLPVRNVGEATVVAEMNDSGEWHGLSALLLLKSESYTSESIILVKDIFNSHQIDYKMLLVTPTALFDFDVRAPMADEFALVVVVEGLADVREDPGAGPLTILREFPENLHSLSYNDLCKVIFDPGFIAYNPRNLYYAISAYRHRLRQRRERLEEFAAEARARLAARLAAVEYVDGLALIAATYDNGLLLIAETYGDEEDN